MNEIFPLYKASDQIYGENGSVCLPFVLVRKMKETPKARLLRNVVTRQEAWFPESIFSYHWHILSAIDMQLFLIIPEKWIKKKTTFFLQHRMI